MSLKACHQTFLTLFPFLLSGENSIQKKHICVVVKLAKTNTKRGVFMSTLQNKSLNLNIKVQISNDGGSLSNDASMTLMFESFHQTHFDEWLNDDFKMMDHRFYPTHIYG